LTYKISKIIGEHTCKGRAKAAAVPPKYVRCTLESIPDFKQHPCCLTYFLATAQESKQRKPLATKVFNRKKQLILGSLRMYPFKLCSNGVLAICPKNKPFLAETLNAGKSSGGATRDWN